MPVLLASALVMFSAEQMFRLVNDVHAYPEFLPGCVGNRVHESGEDYMMASVGVAKAGIAKTFTTRNRLRCQPRHQRWSWWRPSASWRAGGPFTRSTRMLARWSSISTSSSPQADRTGVPARSSVNW